MGKVVIETDMEMPNKCTECKFLYSTYTLYCNLTKKDVPDIHSKPNWCPLRELPENENTFDVVKFYDSIEECLKEFEMKKVS